MSKHKREPLSARKTAQADLESKPRADPRDYGFRAASEVAQEAIANGKAIRLLAFCRVSNQQQADDGHLEHQARDLSRHCPAGIKIVGHYWFVAKGYQCDTSPHWRRATLRAKRLDAAGFVTESTSRAIRSHDYSPRDQRATPTREEFEALQRATEGMVWATVVPPEATPSEIRRHEIARGERQDELERYLATRDGKWQLNGMKVYLMHQSGLSLGQIAKLLGLPKGTVQTYVAKLKGHDRKR